MAEEKIWKCPACGKDIHPGDQVCMYCGATIHNTNASVDELRNYEAGTPSKSKGNFRFLLFIILGVVLLIAFASFLVYFTFFRGTA